jgi:hypothetical protein
MEVYLMKGCLSCELIPHEEHTDHPEEEDIVTCLENISRIVFLEEFTWFFEVPVEDRERPKS